MILQHELQSPSAGQHITRRWQRIFVSAAMRHIAVFVLFLAAVIALQTASGAYQSEFAGYPDEPAHYVTSLMVHNYIASLHFASPLQFARDYYHHYPKVALGHWPPFFYLLQGCWMLLFSPSRISVLLELAATTALLAFSVYLVAERWFGRVAGILAGLLLVCVPLVQKYTDEEMAETLLALTCFWSAVYFARYVDSERWQDNALFGVFFALAVLTKGSGWLLALVPLIVLTLVRKWQLVGLVGRRSFWAGPAIVALLCLPWQIFTLGMAERGWVGSSPNASYLVSALGQFFIILVTMVGYAVAILAAVGIVTSVVRPAFKGRAPSIPAAMLALIVSDWVFHSIVPAGVEDRKMIMAAPALILLAVAGVYWLADRIPVSGNRNWRRAAVAIAACLGFCAQTFAIPHELRYGYIEAARFIASDPQLRSATILVSSESQGEGLLISELAMREPKPGYVVVRGTKALAHVDWAASSYQSLFSTPQQLLDFLKDQHIALVVMDTYPPQNPFLHDRLLWRAIEESGDFRLIASFGNGVKRGSGQVEIFRFEPNGHA